MNRLIRFLPLALALPVWGFDLVGTGGFEYKSAQTGRYTPVVSVLEHNRLDNVNAVSLWITRQWESSWYPSAEVNKRIVDKGYTPIFILYWFADDISVGYIREHEEEYYAYLKRFRSYLDEIEGEKIVVLNPEYNQFGVEGWEGYNRLLLKSAAILDEGDVIMGPCVGDFGNYDAAQDPRNWKRFDASLRDAMHVFDFIAFQEMRSLTRNTPAQIQQTARRIESFSAYLHTTYRKPVFLAYLALSTWGEKGEYLQEGVMRELARRQPVLEKNGLMGINLFHLIDVPGHVGYFGPGEEHFGILRSDGTAKSSAAVFKLIRSGKKIK